MAVSTVARATRAQSVFPVRAALAVLGVGGKSHPVTMDAIWLGDVKSGCS